MQSRLGKSAMLDFEGTLSIQGMLWSSSEHEWKSCSMEKRKSLADPFDYAIPCALIVYPKNNPPFGDEAAKRNSGKKSCEGFRKSYHLLASKVVPYVHQHFGYVAPPELFLSQL